MTDLVVLTRHNIYSGLELLPKQGLDYEHCGDITIVMVQKLPLLKFFYLVATLLLQLLYSIMYLLDVCIFMFLLCILCVSNIDVINILI